VLLNLLYFNQFANKGKLAPMRTCAVRFEVRGEEQIMTVNCSTPVALLIQNLNVSLDVVGGIISTTVNDDGIMVNDFNGFSDCTLHFLDFIPGKVWTQMDTYHV
jgi:hypothetical protein